MSALSKLNPLLRAAIRTNITAIARRQMSEHRTFDIQPSRWQWNKTKDFMNFYILLGAIPLGVVTFCANVFIGPASLAEIPDDYVPKHWEYYRSPITRFIARYCLDNPQQDYEKYLHYIFEESERQKMRNIERDMKERMAERMDYQAYYYKKALAKYPRISKEAYDYLKSIEGD